MHGSSDAPAYETDDVILINRTAYDLTLPFTNRVLLAWSDPETGEVIGFENPSDGEVVYKRVVAGPGVVVQMRENHLIINGRAMEYSPVGPTDVGRAEGRDRLGAVTKEEGGAGKKRVISYTPGASPQSSFGPVTVPPRHCFVLGDNRDRSEDSRTFGPVPREKIRGRVIGRLSHNRDR